jgi:uridine phosphorylase
MKSQKEKGIVEPKPIRGFSKKTVLYIPVDLPFFKIKKILKQRAKKTKETTFGELYGFEDKVVLSRCVGAPLAVLTLERLIISGAQEIVILGFCGALDGNINIGEAVSVIEAASEEGTSRHYSPQKRLFEASSVLKARVEGTLEKHGLPFVNGSVVSTDAPYRETPSWLERNRAKGIGFVDMETSAVFALADFYGIQAAALHLVSDKLTSSSHHVGFNSLRLGKNIKRYFFPFIDAGAFDHDRSDNT